MIRQSSPCWRTKSADMGYGTSVCKLMRFLQEKALLYAQQLGLPEGNFNAPSGWLNKFRWRHKINFSSVCGERACVSQTMVNEWREMALSLIHLTFIIWMNRKISLSSHKLPPSILNEDCKEVNVLKRALYYVVTWEAFSDRQMCYTRCFRNLNVQHLPVRDIK